MLALRLAELDFVGRNEMGKTPFFYLTTHHDSIRRRAHLWKYIDRGIQTVITTTDKKALNEFPKPAKVFKVKSALSRGQMAVRINVAIESSLRRFGIVRKVKRSQAVFMWEDIVGPAAAKVSTAVTCRDGILL